MQLLVNPGFKDPACGYALTATLFRQVAEEERPATVSITPSSRHVGVTRRDTRRDGFREAVRAAEEEGYPVLLRSAGGGAIAADGGAFGFSIIRPAEQAMDPMERYEDAADFVLGAFSRLGVEAGVGEVRDEFCPGDHSIRARGYEDGMKLVGIAQRVTRTASSTGGIVIVEGARELARVLSRVYGAMGLPLRPGSVGSLRRTGCGASVPEVMDALAAEAASRYGAQRVEPDENTRELAARFADGYRVPRLV